MRLLVLSGDPVTASDVREALGGDADVQLEGAEVLVVSPALNESALAFWVSDSDEAILDARGTTGESEPLLALQDALATFPADLVLVFTRPDDSERHGEHDLVAQVRERFDVPVRGATLRR